MIWTQRYRWGNGKVTRYARTEDELLMLIGAPKPGPVWLFPIVTRERLERMLDARFGTNSRLCRKIMANALPLRDRWYASSDDWFDLRNVVRLVRVARMAYPERIPAHWPCSVCGTVVSRFTGTPSWAITDGEIWECSPECTMKVVKASLYLRDAALEKLRAEQERQHQWRKEEWQRIKECKSLLKQARKLVREGVPEVYQSRSAASGQATTSPN